jgi:predicted nucleic acid-binding protein
MNDLASKCAFHDTTPLNYLILIGYVEVLATLYGYIISPQTVADELRDPRTPDIVRTWIAAPPPWCTIHQPQVSDDPTLRHLGDGEREALLLVQELRADALLTDDSTHGKRQSAAISRMLEPASSSFGLLSTALLLLAGSPPRRTGLPKASQSVK